MTNKRTILSKIRYGSVLIGILRLIGLLSLYNDSDHYKRGRPYVYSTTVILRCFVVRVWMRIPSNNALHYYFSISTKHNSNVMRACGLHTLPDRRTFDRRFKTLPIRDVISTMGNRFVAERLTDAATACVDSTLIHAAKMRVWHVSHQKQNILPHSGIDTDARWGKSKSKGWVYGYKLHMSCSTGVLPVPLSADFTTANIQDNQMYYSIVENLPDNTIRYVAADLGYDDHELYEYSWQHKRIRLVCPVRRRRHTKGERLKLVQLCQSRAARKVYKKRSTSIEPLFECIKNAFSLYVMPVRGFGNARSWTLMCVLVYQLAVYYNCIMNNDEPRCIKRMVGN